MPLKKETKPFLKTMTLTPPYSIICWCLMTLPVFCSVIHLYGIVPMYTLNSVFGCYRNYNNFKKIIFYIFSSLVVILPHSLLLLLLHLWTICLLEASGSLRLNLAHFSYAFLLNIHDDIFKCVGERCVPVYFSRFGQVDSYRLEYKRHVPFS